MAAHISLSGRRFAVEDGETVLECLTRNGVHVPHACCSGVCQTCLMQAAEGDIPTAAQAGLKPTYVKQNLFLACQCRPEGDLTLRSPDGGGIDIPARVVGRDMLNHDVMRLRIRPSQEFGCEPGQYITLINSAGTPRSYSVANNPGSDGYIELQVRLLPGGSMSGFLRSETEIGTPMTVRGPAGSCFYVPDDSRQFPIVLAGTGTGLAPLYGIARQAIVKGHVGPIALFHGALRESDLYLVEELQALETSHGNFRYVPCVLGGAPGQFYRCGHIEEAVMTSLTEDRQAARLFLCGAPDFVQSLKRKAFLAGVRSSHIHSDAFLPSKSVATAS